ncbi:hypothetical protein PFICI_09364 [Pestalotiopsis fici W106-1]|uniref:3beta-hydroxysteroid 3-dehydrogenase n=1 Tax=Pestalotiopsis fici (strain W106-1 / CGMCC3.15140) TaxID=1229662 RepID=W3X2Y5_PESFW|nr:uncharacterized protein PFICI_09364 [Pestalotiopsis fici W106-1]ETS79511.1 hypothetical protein PFICI_09364 [Pestalotiopsis fici W106-1]
MATAAATGTILITGANGGLGSAMVQHIISKPELAAYHGLYTVRDTTHAPDLTTALAHGTAHSYDIMSLDLARLDSVRQAAESINSRISAGVIPPIRALILNAGFMDFGKQSWTADKLETAFAVNYLGHWLLTMLLLKSIDKENGRVVIIGSHTHDTNDPRHAVNKAFADPKYKYFLSDADSFHAIAKGKWSTETEDASFRGGYRRYGASKYLQITMQHELQARLNADAALNKICVVGVDPGPMISGLQRLAPWFIRVLIFRIIYALILYLKPINGMIRSTTRSASDVLEAVFVVDEEGNPPKDKYWDGRTPSETSEESRDVSKRELVWKETVKLAGLKEGETVLANWS